ncbi:Ig-like domain-containing protein [Actinoalloteichus sp. GBA129-24]|uniref:Ig-like domain-containing protein n=1 Tax=Actinoalloteichus sp. GBA129-24 TaxID=1612551 RepID=UPI0009503887|nr:Ig-like domain-containing protein [Actinoalloteichus sp. GBA129-24]APU20950.1 Ig-like domain-containing protein [Actinoalloteichus sp. GBA129-24]APU24199.1 Ig-like domain-containing protein [Actinoalloteichus sp. GBA129-24]
MATQQLAATLNMSDGSTQTVTSTATWTSSDDEVATVSTGGLVTAVAEGAATITAAHSGQSGTCAVTVPAAEAESLSVTPPTATVELG